LTTEFVDGLTFHEILARSQEAGQILPPSLALELVEQLSEGLQYAHTLVDAAGQGLGLVLRDLKPANLILSRDGMAKATSNLRESTMTGTAKGTLVYMSPEQVRGVRDISAASDLFAVGAGLYELVTGQRLFEANSVMSIMFAAVAGVDPEKLAEAEAILPGVGPILGRCVAQEPADRWASANDLGRALRALRETMSEPPNAARFVARALLHGPHRVDPQEASTRSRDLRAFVEQVRTLVGSKDPQLHSD
jgi:serine/threonine protein kinase